MLAVVFKPNIARFSIHTDSTIFIDMIWDYHLHCMIVKHKKISREALIANLVMLHHS